MHYIPVVHVNLKWSNLAMHLYSIVCANITSQSLGQTPLNYGWIRGWKVQGTAWGRPINVANQWIRTLNLLSDGMRKFGRWNEKRMLNLGSAKRWWAWDYAVSLCDSSLCPIRVDVQLPIPSTTFQHWTCQCKYALVSLVKSMVLLVQLKYLGSFQVRDLIFMDASEMISTVGFIVYQLVSGFVQACVLSTFKFDAISFIIFLAWILIYGYFDFRTFVLSFIFENSRSNFMLKLMQLLCRFDFWNTFIELDFFAGLCHSSSAVFLRIRSVRMLYSIASVCSKPLVWLFSPAQFAVKLACQEAVFICLAVTDERQMSCSRESRKNAWHPLPESPTQNILPFTQMVLKLIVYSTHCSRFNQ
jgi:hypothetical protein